jgi:pimeloyl-ACP methyl ester carboxylesterase
VVVVSSDDPLAPGTRQAIAALVNADGVVGPKVLIGSDAGAVTARALAGDPTVDPAAVVLAGYPIGAGRRDDDWQSEIEARTTCPTHRNVLREHARPDHHDQPAAVETVITVPALAVHGSADTIAPLDAALEEYTKAGISEAVVVEGGQHDILNDITHRSVAAALVQFLERMKAGAQILRTVELPVD